MASLTGTKIKDTYDSLLKVSDNGGLGATAKQITDGLGTGSPIYASTSSIGIGMTPITAKFEVLGESRVYTGASLSYWGVDAGNSVAYFGTNTSGYGLSLQTSGSEAMRIDSSGRVGIGVTPSSTTGAKSLDVAGVIIARGLISDHQTSAGVLDLNGDMLSLRAYGATAGSGYIVFKTGGGGGSSDTERMRITSGGYLKASNTGTYYSSSSVFHELRSNSDGNITAMFSHNGASNPYGIDILFNSSSPDNNTNYFINASDSFAARFKVYSDGDVWTSDAGTLTSDETLKRDIVDATPKLDDIMKLRVRNYYWREDYHPNKQDQKLIGFIAQEFEQVFPKMVSEHTIKDAEYETIEHTAIEATYDEEGNELTPAQDAWTETTDVLISEEVRKKGIKEGKLIPIIVKAMQEQQEIIESQGDLINKLEARIAALEAR